MNRRNFMAGLFGTTVAGVAVNGTAVKGDKLSATAMDLTPEEQAMLEELERVGAIFIPSRKSVLRTQELSDKRNLLIRLVHKNRCYIDIHIANREDELDETCTVFIACGKGKTPLDTYIR